MTVTAGIDLGSVYTKVAVIDDGRLAATAMRRTGFKLEEAAEATLEDALREAGFVRDRIDYVASTGYGRNQVNFRDIQVTDLTAQAWGTRFFFPRTQTVLDIGAQTMKALKLDGAGRVKSFRLNDKCAAGTGAFLEKTATYLGYLIEEIGPLVEYSEESVPISGVCAVFAESEVINHVSNGAQPADIMHGAMSSLIERSVRLMKRVKMEPEFTLVGGIMRFPAMTRMMREQLGAEVNVPTEPLAQFTGAIGAGVLAGRRLEKLGQQEVSRTATEPASAST
jgi:predicted CoA-substrate-specific enzyme activase